MIASQTGLRKETILFTLNIYYQTPLWTKEVFTASFFFLIMFEEMIYGLKNNKMVLMKSFPSLVKKSVRGT